MCPGGPGSNPTTVKNNYVDLALGYHKSGAVNVDKFFKTKLAILFQQSMGIKRDLKPCTFVRIYTSLVLKSSVVHCVDSDKVIQFLVTMGSNWFISKCCYTILFLKFKILILTHYAITITSLIFKKCCAFVGMRINYI